MRGMSFNGAAGEILASREPRMHFVKSDPAIGAKPGKTPKPIDQMEPAQLAQELAEELISAITSLVTTQNGDTLDPDQVIEAAAKTALAAMRRRHGATTDRGNDPAGDPSLNPSYAQRPAEVAGSGSIAQAAMPTSIRKALAVDGPSVAERLAALNRDLDAVLTETRALASGRADRILEASLHKSERVGTPGVGDALLKGDSIPFEAPIAKRAINLEERIDSIDDLIGRISKRDRAPLAFSAAFGGGPDHSNASSYTPIEAPTFADTLAKRLRERDRAGVEINKLLS